MNTDFYFESIQNDIKISDLEYEVESDRVNLLFKSYNDILDLYQESDNSDHSTFVLEAGEKISSAIKNIIKAVISFINKCVEIVRNLIATDKVKKLKKDYEKAIKEDPSIKDKKIEYDDETERILMIDKHLVRVKGKIKNVNEMDEEIKE